MNKQEQIQKVEEKIQDILDQMESETDPKMILDLHSLFEIYMDRRQELMK